MTENKIYKTQVKQYANQIMNLYNILKQKNKIISVYKQQEGIIDNNSLEFEFEKKMEGMKISLSQENLHLMNNSTFNTNNNTNTNTINSNTNNNINIKDVIFDTSKDESTNSNNNTFNIGNKKNNDTINKSIDKLINDNEENKKIIIIKTKSFQ